MVLIIADPVSYTARLNKAFYISKERIIDTHKKAERNLITLCFYRPLLSSIAIYYEYHLPLNFNDVLFDITALP